MSDLPALPTGYTLDQPPLPPGYKLDQPAPAVSANEAVAHSLGADYDEHFSQGRPGAILDAFGQGAKDGWGARPLGLDPEADKWLQKHAPDYGVLGRAFHDQIVRPAAAGIDALFRAPAAVIRGVSEPLVRGGVPAELTPEGLFEAFPLGHATGLPARIPMIDRAADLGVIGKGEAGWKGLPEAVEALTPTGETVARPVSREPFGPAMPAPEAFEPATPPPPDYHAIARQLAPDTFTSYDALAAQKDTITSFINDLAEQRAKGTSPEIAALDSQIEQLRAQRLEAARGDRAGLANQITALEEQRAKLAAALPETGDTAEMARLRQARQELDYKMRDLAPQVSDAYRRAQAGEAAEAAAEPASAPVVPAAAEIAQAPEPATVAPPAPVREAPPVRVPVEGGIAADVSRKLVAAGRPLEEAEAAAQIVEARYTTRAAHLGITPEESYAEAAPDIVAGKKRGAARLKEFGVLGRTTTRGGAEGAVPLVKLFERADVSTFLHEMGHVWLEELFDDALDPRALPNVKADMDIVQKWLGLTDEQLKTEIPTRQHEKFARSFERYLMEGHAPSEGLAAVFAQFKEWMTTLYARLRDLSNGGRLPKIDDEIRGVFDRMLAATGNKKPVIAPEREPTGTFADIHETDALHTEPAHAAETAGNIRSERDRIGEAAAPEIEDERTGARTAAEARRGTGGSGVSDKEGARTGSSGGSPGGVSKSSPVGKGGGNAPPEGNRPPGKSEPPSGPNTIFGPADKRLIDKAGNIRVENLNVPEDVAAAIHQAAEEKGGFITARRGVISDGEVLQLADALGMDPASLSRRKLGEAFNAEQIVAARQLLIRSATEVRGAMAKAAAGTDADVIAYGVAKARHLMVQEQVSGITAEAGRALRAFRAIEGSKDAEALGEFLHQSTGRTLNQMRKEAQLGQQLDTPQKISKFVQDSEKPTWKDYIIEAWINALLSGPITHIKNMIGNSAVAVNTVIETAGAAAIGEARARLTGTAERVHFAEVKARFFGLVKGSKDGIIAAGRALADEGSTQFEAHTLEQRRFQAIPSVKVNVAGIDMELGGKQIRLPGRFLTAEDEFFKAVAARQELNALAYRAAASEGLIGDAFDARVASLLEHPTKAMVAASRKNAEYQTFTNALGPMGRAVQQFANGHVLAKVVIPFIRTPVNIAKYANERTPFGLLSREVRDNLRGRNGEVARDTQIARMALGTMVATATAGLVAQGLITGAGPSDPKQKAALRLTGWQPYSVKIGGMYYSYAWLDPLGTIVGVTADLTDAAKAGTADDAELEKVAAMTVASVGKNLMSKLSLRGTSDFIQTLTDPDRYGPKYLASLAGSVVPSVVAQVARIEDPVMRDARTVMDTIKSRIPGLRETVMPRRDLWGEPIPNQGALGPDLLSPIVQSRINNDPVNRALVDLKFSPAPPEHKIRGVELTPKQYDDYSRISGRMAKMELDAVVPALRSAPPDQQIKTISAIVAGWRETTETQIMIESMGTANDIMKKATESKAALLGGATREHAKQMMKAP